MEGKASGFKGLVPHVLCFLAANREAHPPSGLLESAVQSGVFGVTQLSGEDGDPKLSHD